MLSYVKSSIYVNYDESLVEELSQTVKDYTSFKVRQNFIDLEDHMLVPRGLRHRFSNQIDFDLTKSVHASYNFTATLRSNQEPPLAKLLKSYRTKTDLILVAECGFGKTVSACYTISKLQQKTLILVPKVQLADQFLDSINTFLGEGVGIIASTKLLASKKNTINSIVEAYDIVVMTYDLFESRFNPKDTWVNSFGLVVFDEMHRTGCETLLPSFFKLPMKYRLGLTATLRRSDGMEEQIIKHFQDVIITEGRPESEKATLHTFTPKNKVVFAGKFSKDFVSQVENFNIPGIHTYKENIIYCSNDEESIRSENDESLGTEELLSLNKIFQKRLEYVHLETAMGSFEERNNEFLELIRKKHTEGRAILVLGKRIAQLEALFNQVSELDPILLTSKTYKKIKESPRLQEQLEKEARIIFGIDTIASEGLDIPRLDTLIFLSVVGDPEQAGGRILRKYSNKKEPEIWIPIGENDLHTGMYYKSLKYLPKVAKTGKYN
ncbi:DEAD/DEAH box helicase [Flammeovirga agarivorans]|uniref:DEAD/DEAH box helicase family protein n=1 Tax=Flammeovirga agarivorans TaxID=2726742 RepID=A0A7X8XZG0_9BACT|nr:DEAD/DEAH box helicase family protein [Flammeovirga agarivorans]NLR94940.1 DEAD/DEAH box helicase family protein [Flammeovirga agarivorans]